MTRSTFSSAARRLNSATTLSPGPASSVRTGTSFAPPMPPSSLIFSTQASAAFFAGIPTVLEAGPERSAEVREINRARLVVVGKVAHVPAVGRGRDDGERGVGQT